MQKGNLALVFTMTVAACAAGEQPAEVQIYVSGGHHVNPLIARRAEHQASEMLRAAGVRVVWKIGEPGHTSCCQFQLALRYDIEPRKGSDAMGYAFPYENGAGGITILYKRIVAKRLRPEKMLAHVIVHEVTHMLQGLARHSASGVMKHWWSPEDFKQMERAPLQFTTADIDLIRLGLAKRVAQLSR
jgi:hypothetical protein